MWCWGEGKGVGLGKSLLIWNMFKVIDIKTWPEGGRGRRIWKWKKLDGLLRLSLQYIEEDNFVQIIESHKTSYNNVYDSKTLYSGLLQEKFVDKICQKENGELFIPGIPDELKTCVLGHDLSSNRTQREFQFEVEDPRSQGRIVKVKAQFEATTCSSPTDLTKSTERVIVIVVSTG